MFQSKFGSQPLAVYWTSLLLVMINETSTAKFLCAAQTDWHGIRWDCMETGSKIMDWKKALSLSKLTKLHEKLIIASYMQALKKLMVMLAGSGNCMPILSCCKLMELHVWYQMRYEICEIYYVSSWDSTLKLRIINQLIYLISWKCWFFGCEARLQGQEGPVYCKRQLGKTGNVATPANRHPEPETQSPPDCLRQYFRYHVGTNIIDVDPLNIL